MKHINFNPTPDDVPALDLPATFANGWNVTMNSNGTRIALGECFVGDETTFHTAIVMPTDRAVKMARLIIELHSARSAVEAPGAEDVTS